MGPCRRQPEAEGVWGAPETRGKPNRDPWGGPMAPETRGEKPGPSMGFGDGVANTTVVVVVVVVVWAVLKVNFGTAEKIVLPTVVLCAINKNVFPKCRYGICWGNGYAKKAGTYFCTYAF